MRLALIVLCGLIGTWSTSLASAFPAVSCFWLQHCYLFQSEARRHDKSSTSLHRVGAAKGPGIPVQYTFQCSTSYQQKVEPIKNGGVLQGTRAISVSLPIENGTATINERRIPVVKNLSQNKYKGELRDGSLVWSLEFDMGSKRIVLQESSNKNGEVTVVTESGVCKVDPLGGN